MVILVDKREMLSYLLVLHQDLEHFFVELGIYLLFEQVDEDIEVVT